ncbi:MAG: Uma2 family endonuclease [Chloroflexi bacterium]|nr:Uma2 family endonuclease [Chloroflexota bacterium]
MGETDWHRKAMMALIEMLEARYRDRQDVYVSGNLFVYYEKGKPSSVFAPDAFVVFGVPKRERRTYKLWEEGGKAPDVVFEVSSESTSLEDEGSKKVICRRLGVSEYFLYDPEQAYLEPPLQGFRLTNGRYQLLTPDANGLYSQQLDLYLRLEGQQLRLIDAATGEHLLMPQEAQAELARLRSELAKLQRK